MIYIAPAMDENSLYAQFAEIRVKCLSRNKIKYVVCTCSIDIVICMQRNTYTGALNCVFIESLMYCTFVDSTRYLFRRHCDNTYTGAIKQCIHALN